MTTFIRAIEAPIDDKSRVLLDAAQGRASAATIFSVQPASFAAVPGSPFSYWVGSGIRDLFRAMPAFGTEDRTVAVGLQTSDDFRFVRAGWEVSGAQLGTRWFGFAKGGSYSPFYADVALTMNWLHDGAEAKAWAGSLYNGSHWSRILKNTHLFFRPGLTWPLRGARLSAQAVATGCIFSVAGKMAFAEPKALPAYLALFNSAAFTFLIRCLSDAVRIQFEAGIIQQTPVPTLTDESTASLARMAHRAWSLKRSLDTVNETSHAFLLPAAVKKIDRDAVVRELATIQRQIDDEVFRLYGISAEDRAAIQGSPISDPESGEEGENDDDDADESAEASDPTPDSWHLTSWLIGVAFGRFDPRLATGDRAIPPEPDPFDPLPARSPGMYPEGEEPADRPDILVDDEGHPGDLAARATAVAEQVKVDPPENLRAWLAKEFFPLHIKMYSKSRRKAPIYWQLATPSASYSVWPYIHAFNRDTLFRVQNDYVGPKLAHEERRLESLTSELRDGASAAQRKELALQEALVEELRAFLEEVKRVAPLWNPNLDDGVIINFAPLWRLVPQYRPWQKELKSTWDALCAGKYDWAHLAMHLWPERVVPKCAKDRSLAIAHGLQDVFWVEGTDGMWTARKTPTKNVDELVRERTSRAVKSALKNLLDAPAASGNGGGGRGGRRRATGAAQGANA